jgi:hypothetical protein
MGLFDRFRRKPTQPTPTAASAPAPSWDPTPPLIAAMKTSMILTGQADHPDVGAVYDAVEAALRAAFGDQVPLCWTRTPPASLALVRVYWVEGAGGAHFHYVGWGLTELGPKVSAVAETSGFGIELTIKVRAFADERVAPEEPIRALQAPLWPVELLARLAAGIQRTRRPYGHEHWIQAGVQPFGPEALRHFACAFDEAFGPVETPNGRFRFLQLYAVDDGELAQLKEADLAGTKAPVLAARRALDPDLVIPRRQQG